MSISNHWRNKQLQNNLLWQELQCFNFCQRHNNIKWSWHGARGHFFNWCQSSLDINNDNANGVIIINTPMNVTINQFVSTIDSLIHDKIKVAYLAVNRYHFVIPNVEENKHFPDHITDCINLIVSKTRRKFRRLYTPTQVDGRHFVGVHGLDAFVYEDNN